VRARTDSPLKMIRAEVVESEVESAVKAVEELKSEGKEVTRFVGIRLTTPTLSTQLGWTLLSLPGRTPRPGTPRQEEGGQGVQEVRLGTLEEREGLRSEVVDRVGLLGRGRSERPSGRRASLAKALEAVLKFWAYAWMTHLANLVVGRAPGVEVKG